MQVFLFNIANSRLRRYSSGVIYEDTYPNTVFKFNFNTPEWELVSTKTAVFSCHGKNHHEPLNEHNMCAVPKEVLHEGYFLVSIEGGPAPTNSVRVPVAPMPEDLKPDTPGGNCDCGPSVVYVPTIDEKKILSWSLQEATNDMVVPEPVDLNPNDEWTEDETESEYVWEEE